MQTKFFECPEINSRSMEILSQMQLYIMSPEFRSAYISTLPPLIPSERHGSSAGHELKKESENDLTEVDMKNGDQESDADSVRMFFVHLQCAFDQNSH